MKIDRVVAKVDGLGTLSFKLPPGILRRLDAAGYLGALELALNRTQVALVAAAAHPSGGHGKLAEYTARLNALTDEFVAETKPDQPQTRIDLVA
jgi:hypothetical protein